MIRQEMRRLLKGKHTVLILSVVILYSIFSSIYCLNQKESKAVAEVIAITDSWNWNEDNIEEKINLEIKDHSAASEDRLQYVQRLKATVEERESTLAKMKESPIFQDEKDQLMIDEEMKVVKELNGYEMKPINDVAAQTVISFTVVDAFIILVCGCYMVYILFIQERDCELLNLFDATKSTAGKRMISKMVVLFIAVMIIACIRTVMNLAVISLSGVSLKVPMQMLLDHDLLNVSINIGEYYVMFCLLKIMTVILLLVSLVFLILLLNNTAVALTGLSVFMIVEYVIAKYLSVTSNFSFLVKKNIYTILTSVKIESGFTVVWNRVISDPVYVLIILVGISLLMIVMIMLVNGRQGGKVRQKGSMKTWKFNSFAFFRWKDLLISKKGLLIYVLIVAYCIVNAMTYTATRSEKTLMFEEFRKSYFGVIDDDLTDRIDHEILEGTIAEEEANEIMERISSDEEVDEETMRHLDELKQKTDRLDHLYLVQEEVYEFKANGSEYYYADSGMEYFINKNGSAGGKTEYLLVLMPLIMLVVLCMSSIYENRMEHLYFSTEKGKKNILSGYFRMFMIVFMIMYCSVFAIRYYKIVRFYRIDTFMTPVSHALGVKSGLPFGIYLLVMALSQMIYTGALCVLAMNLSEKYDRITCGIVMILAVVVSVFIPVGPGILFRYDMLSHIAEYASVIGISLLYCVLYYVKICRNA